MCIGMKCAAPARALSRPLAARGPASSSAYSGTSMSTKMVVIAIEKRITHEDRRWDILVTAVNTDRRRGRRGGDELHCKSRGTQPPVSGRDTYGPGFGARGAVASTIAACTGAKRPPAASR